MKGEKMYKDNEDQFFRPTIDNHKEGTYGYLDYRYLADYVIEQCGLVVNTKTDLRDNLGKMSFISSPNIQAISVRIHHQGNEKYGEKCRIKTKMSFEGYIQTNNCSLWLTVQVLDKNYQWNQIVQKLWEKTIKGVKKEDLCYFDNLNDNYSYTIHDQWAKLNREVKDIISLIKHLLINSGVRK